MRASPPPFGTVGDRALQRAVWPELPDGSRSHALECGAERAGDIQEDVETGTLVAGPLEPPNLLRLQLQPLGKVLLTPADRDAGCNGRMRPLPWGIERDLADGTAGPRASCSIRARCER